MPEAVLERFLRNFRASLEDGSLVKLTLSQPAERNGDLRNLYARVVELKDGPRISFVWRYATRDVTKNVPFQESEAVIRAHLGSLLTRGSLMTLGGDWHLRLGPGSEGRLKAGPPTSKQLPAASHDRARPKALAGDSPFLRALGLTNAEGAVRPGMADKLRQIERFTELLGHLVADSPLAQSAAVRAVDMGAGKGYLTFASYEFFLARSVSIEMTGVELREELVDQANRTAAAAGFSGLRFVRGSINDYPQAPLDVLLALHACDTATDEALFYGIRAGASLILSAPCCHKEVRLQMATPDVLREVHRHGILLEREAEILTDALRALLLEIHGYKASVFEFISPEHTGKNLMIAAQRRTQPLDPAPLRARLRGLMEFYGLGTQRLARLLGEL